MVALVFPERIVLFVRRLGLDFGDERFVGHHSGVVDHGRRSIFRATGLRGVLALPAMLLFSTIRSFVAHSFYRAHRGLSPVRLISPPCRHL